MFKRRGVKQTPLVFTTTEDVDPDHLVHDPLNDRLFDIKTARLFR
jgi:hypothetical protein